MDKLIEKFDMVVKIIDVDHIDGLKLKNVNVIVYEEQCANITKEVSCGFAEWIRVKTINTLKGYIMLDRTEGFFTLDRLFDIYIKSL